MSRKWMIAISGAIVTVITIISEALKIKIVNPENLNITLLGAGAFIFGKWAVDKNRQWTKEGAIKKFREPSFWLAVISVLSPFIGLIPTKISIDPNIVAGAIAILMGTIFRGEYNNIPKKEKNKAAKIKKERNDAVKNMKLLK